MIPKPTHRPRKLLPTILLTLTLSLCALTTLAATLLTTGHTLDLTFGSFHYRLQITSNTVIMTPDTNIRFGIGPLPNFADCERLSPSIAIAQLELTSYHCLP